MPSVRRKCRGGCGLWLSDPESLARGFGKRCAERLGITSLPLKPARTSPPAVPVPHVPGQTELPFQDHLPTL